MEVCDDGDVGGGEGTSLIPAIACKVLLTFLFPVIGLCILIDKYLVVDESSGFLL